MKTKDTPIAKQLTRNTETIKTKDPVDKPRYLSSVPGRWATLPCESATWTYLHQSVIV
jgi:hypothetical protein